MSFGIGTGMGIAMSIAIVSRAAARADAGRFAFDETVFMPGIDPMPGMPGIVLGFGGGLVGCCDGPGDGDEARPGRHPYMDASRRYAAKERMRQKRLQPPLGDVHAARSDRHGHSASRSTPP